MKYHSHLQYPIYSGKQDSELRVDKANAQPSLGELVPYRIQLLGIDSCLLQFITSGREIKRNEIYNKYGHRYKMNKVCRTESFLLYQRPDVKKRKRH